MDKEKILAILRKKEVKDYTYAILFFGIASFFAFFAIKPALSIAFTLKQQATQLRKTDDIYEKNINQILQIQNDLEKIRDKTYIVEEAIPKMPDTKILVDDIRQAANSEGITIREFNLSAVDLKKKGRDENLKSLSIDMETDANFSQINSFIRRLAGQRRLKQVSGVKITRKEVFSTESAQLKINLEIESFYL